MPAAQLLMQTEEENKYFNNTLINTSTALERQIGDELRLLTSKCDMSENEPSYFFLQS